MANGECNFDKSMQIYYSYGIACFYDNKLIFGERPYTYAFVEWIKHVSDNLYTYEMLCREIDKMTEIEKGLCYKLQVEVLYALTKCYCGIKHTNISKNVLFSQYKSRLETEPSILNYLGCGSKFSYKPSQWKWDIPKGHKIKSRSESDISCAQREFNEETGKCIKATILYNIHPLLYQFDDCEQYYVYKWYFAETNVNPLETLAKMSSEDVRGSKKSYGTFRNGHEFVNLHLVTYEEVCNMTNIHTDAFRAVFDKYLKYKNTCMSQ